MRSLTILAALLSCTTAVASPGNAVDVCHSSGNSGNTQMLSVNANALSAHIAHGDWLPMDFFVDADGDGYGDASATVFACVQPTGTTTDGSDCDDDDGLVSPGATEVCDNGIDDDCDGQIDEGCLVEVEIKIIADNAYYLWIDGQPFSGLNAPDWTSADTYTLLLPAGDHTVAAYVEDWGGLAWFAGTVRADGELIAQTGDGTWLSNGTVVTNGHTEDTYDRAANWPASPYNGVSGLLPTPPVGWNATSYDDSAWTPAEVCSGQPVAWYDRFANQHADIGDLRAEGTEWVFPSEHDCWNLTTGRWQTALFRNNFSL